MTSDASLGLHRSILNALNDNSRIRGLLGAVGRIYGEDLPCDKDHLHDQVYPRIIVRSGTARCWHSATFDGQEHSLVVDIFSMGPEQEIRQLSSAVIERLHDTDLPICGHALVSLDFECSETTMAENTDGKADQGRLYFKALTISD